MCSVAVIPLSHLPWPVLLQPWSSSLPQIPSYGDEAVGWDLSGSWWKSKERQLQGWWGSEAHCSHPPPPPYGRLVLVPMGPRSEFRRKQKMVIRKSQTELIIKICLYFTLKNYAYYILYITICFFLSNNCIDMWFSSKRWIQYVNSFTFCMPCCELGT